MQFKKDFFEKKKKEIGVSLNEVQKRAVLHTEGPLLLLASPGSGKTTTTIMRIGYLIEEKGVHPSRIKAVTFSRASAADMKERFKRFFPQHTENSVDFSTIHSLAFEVARDYFYKRNIRAEIIEGNKDSGPQKKQILRQLFKRINQENITEDQLEDLTTYVSFIKNKLIPESQWDTVKTEVPQAKRIMQEYERFKKSASGVLLVDFDDMLTFANEAFASDPELLKKFQRRYDYVLTDESQDTSMVQHAIMGKLVAAHQNLYVVADDDQSIYGWRAAEPQYLLDFKKVYPNAVILMMEQNYRSSKEIVNTANLFIKQNKHRYNKNMFTENPPHQSVEIKQFEEYRFQAKYLVEQIGKTDRFRDAAVLFRNNSSSIILVNEFDRAGIPFYIKDHDNRFFSHWVVKDLLNFMRLSYNDRRVDIFEQIYTKLDVFVQKEQIAKLKNTISVFDQLSQMIDGTRAKRLQDYKQIFQSFRDLTPLAVIKVIRVQLGYDKAIENIAKKLKFNKTYLMNILFTLEEIASSLSTMEEFAARLKDLETVIHTSKFNKGKDAVTLSTFHSSKGLEFKTVYMIDLIQGVIPSDDDLENSDLLEEAVRLFYVGMTRAKMNLELLSYKKQFGKNVGVSQFVRDVKRIIAPPVEIQKKKTRPEKVNVPKKHTNPNAIRKAEDLKVGMFVIHRVYGRGIIIQFGDDLIELQFQKDKKKFDMKTCFEMGILEPLEKVRG